MQAFLYRSRQAFCLVLSLVSATSPPARDIRSVRNMAMFMTFSELHSASEEIGLRQAF